MNKKALALIALVFVALCGAWFLLPALHTPERTNLERLTVKGTQLYAGDDSVCFKGVSYGWHNIWPRFYNEQSVASLKNDWNVKIVRAAIGSDDIAKADNPGIPGGYREEKVFAFKKLFAVIDGAIANDMYVIVDFHSHVTYKELAGEFFAAVATKYKGVPNVIYELFNEPVCFSFEDGRENKYEDLGNPEAMAAYWQNLKDYAEYVIGKITAIDDSKPLILMGCPSWDQRIDLPMNDPITCYDNLMYTVHFYAATHKEELRDATEAAIKAGTPVFISECAACEADGNGTIDMESWAAWDSLATNCGVSMMTWSISDKDETCSMFTKEAASEGPWADDVIKPWGRIVKDWIK